MSMLQHSQFRLSTPAAQGQPGSSSDTLKALLSQTRKLQSDAASSSARGAHDSLPEVQLGLDQIESQSRRLRSRASRADGHDAALGGDGQGLGAHYLLAGGGVNADELGRTINAVDLKGTFEPLQPLHDADVEVSAVANPDRLSLTRSACQGFLRHEHEQSIISSIEEGRRQTVQQFYDRLDQSLRQDWARQKEALFEELRRNPAESTSLATRSRERGRQSLQATQDPDSVTMDLGGSLDMHGRMMRYETAISSINASRREHMPCGVASILAAACAAAVSDNKTQGLSDTWRLLKHIVGESEGADIGDPQRALPRERAYSKAYLGTSASSAAVSLRKRIVKASLTHLEEQCVDPGLASAAQS